MKLNCLFFFILFTLFYRISDTTAQSVVIQNVNGTETIENLSSIQNLTFTTSDLLLSYNGGSTENFSLPTLKKVYFSETLTNIEKNTSDKFTINPNPASDFIRIHNLPEGNVQLQLFSIDGTLIQTTNLSDSNRMVNISDLSKGLYLIKINNHVVKFFKI